MFIVDSQVHLWEEETPDRPWPKGARDRIKLTGHRTEAFTCEEALRKMDEAGVARLLIVPPSWEGDRLDYAVRTAEKHPDRFGVMARVPQNKPEEGKAMMRDWKDIPGIKGARLTFHRKGVDMEWMVDGTADWYWPLAEELGIKTMLAVPTWKAEVGAIAKRHPGLKLIIDNMGILAGTADEAIAPWVASTAALSEHPNVHVKLSAVPCYTTDVYPFRNVTRYVREMVDRMGPERCFWGSDLTRLFGRGLDYTKAIEHFTKHMGLSEKDLEWIMGRGISECLEWAVPR